MVEENLVLITVNMNYSVDGGRKSASNKCKRSKDEMTLFELCSSYFLNVSHNQPFFNGWDADILIHDIKTAILWNGPWHYKEMGFSNHSLLQVQNRDKIKINEIKNLGWNILIFEDRFYTPEQAFNELVAGEGNAPSSTSGYEPVRRLS